MDADREATRPACRTILNDVATPARFQDAKTKPWNAIVPDDLIRYHRFGGIDKAFGQSRHGNSPV
ncbi:MAG: hypothetical protein Q8R44_15515 [Novosphingobium sp.]|nr:hypothetical protein [Novosphingobium sp.]